MKRFNVRENEELKRISEHIDILAQYVWTETGEFGMPDGECYTVNKGLDYAALVALVKRLPKIDGAIEIREYKQDFGKRFEIYAMTFTWAIFSRRVDAEVYVAALEARRGME